MYRSREGCQRAPRPSRDLVMSRLLLLVALLGTAWCLPRATAHACSCAPLTPNDALAHATMAFEGRVLAISEPLDEPLPHREVTFAVVRAWKGVESVERMVVKTAADGAACGYGFAPDTSYLVFARATDGAPWASLCSGTKPMAEAGEDLQALGMGQTPVDPKADPLPAEPEDEPPASGGCASCAVGSRKGAAEPPGLLPLLLAAGLYARVTSRRRSRSRS